MNPNLVQGLVVNAKASFFYCLVDDKIYECRASKKLITNKQRIITGDYVIIDLTQKYIKTILPRKNVLKRPLVSNVDGALLIFSAIQPPITFMLLDKLILLMEANDLKIYICITKMDLINKEMQIQLKQKLAYYQQLGYQVFYKDQDLAALKTLLGNQKIILTGQSGVGKSTLLNELIPHLNLKTQPISQALNRGKHTTRELTFYPYKNSYLIDTPGFSSLDLNMSKAEIRDNMKEFVSLSDLCRFKGCYHLKEPNCNVKAQLHKNEMYDKRYHHYEILIESVEEKYEKNKS